MGMSVAPTDPALVPADANNNINNTANTNTNTNPNPSPNPNTAAAAAAGDSAAAAAPGSPQDDSGNGPRERHSLTLDQRRALRRWANSQTIRPSHKACIEWFFAQYGQQISQSTVSHSLSPKYSRLDGDNPQLSGSRLRFGNWPDVEKLVLLWYQQVQASGRQPTNEELGDKAKAIFNQLPRYKEETSPEFSPGWIHRFKKRYGLLIRRQRRHGENGTNPAEDIDYLADCVPRFMAIAADTSPAAIRENVLRVVGVEASLNTCALVRDEILRRLSSSQISNLNHPIEPSSVAAAAAASGGTAQTDPQQSQQQPPPQQGQQPQSQQQQQQGQGQGQGQPPHLYVDEDPEVVLQNALRDLQQQEQAAEEQAAAVREERERAERSGMQPSAAMASNTPGARTNGQGFATPGQDMAAGDLSIASMHSDGLPHERALRCPFCVNNRMLRSVKEAVEHMSTHVVV